MWVREVMDCPVFARFGCFRDKGQGRHLEWAQLGLQLPACERADVSAGCELIMDNDVIYIEKSLNRRVIRRGVSAVYMRDSKVKTIRKAFDKGWILEQQSVA